MHAIVRASHWLTPYLVRVELVDGDLASWELPEDLGTDAYVNVAIPPADAPYAAIFNPAEVRELHDRSHWPARRRYTIRSWDPELRVLTLDFVVHGDSGVGGPWAAQAKPGDVLVFEGPGSGYAPDPDADWHLLVGDESALPAIAASLESMGDDASVFVRLVCDGPEHEIDVAGPSGMDLAWLRRSGDRETDTALMVDAVRAIDFPAGRVQAFVHGEADEIRALRRHLLGERGLSRADMSCSPYWRHDMTDEAWRAIKRDFVSAMESDVP